MPKRPRRILRRRWATTEGWRGTRAGMWAWLVQRAAAVALLGVIVLHVRTPAKLIAAEVKFKLENIPLP